VSSLDRAVRTRFATLATRHPVVADPETERAAVEAFTRLWDPTTGQPPSDIVRDTIVERFHQLYYGSADRTWRGGTTYRGTTIWKCPLDLWLYQELLADIRPGLVIETGTAYGGSAYYLGDLCETLGLGNVVTIDTQVFEGRVTHPRVTYLFGSSTSPEILEQVGAMVPPEAPVLVILDSDHTRDHVLGELRALSPLVPVGSCIIVEDTNVNGHPTYPAFGPGPMEALDAFLAETSDFVVDPIGEKFFMTFNPRGVLRRVHCRGTTPQRRRDAHRAGGPAAPRPSAPPPPHRGGPR
jgi:cephalosporin hydroxylase